MDIFVLLWSNFGVPEQFGCLGPLAWPGICARAMYNGSDPFNKRRNSLSRIEPIKLSFSVTHIAYYIDHETSVFHSRGVTIGRVCQLFTKVHTLTNNCFVTML